jgi:NADPH:quinone reductase-like Zn-dependent oxidoreductase
MLSLRPTISARFPLAEAPAAFALLTGDRASDIGRIIIEIGEPV